MTYGLKHTIRCSKTHCFDRYMQLRSREPLQVTSHMTLVSSKGQSFKFPFRGWSFPPPLNAPKMSWRQARSAELLSGSEQTEDTMFYYVQEAAIINWHYRTTPSRSNCSQKIRKWQSSTQAGNRMYLTNPRTHRPLSRRPRNDGPSVSALDVANLNRRHLIK